MIRTVRHSTIFLFTLIHILWIFPPPLIKAADTYDRYAEEIVLSNSINDQTPTSSSPTFLSGSSLTSVPVGLDAPVMKKILVLEFNPILDHKNGVRLRDYMNWNDPHILNDQLISSLSQVSSGTVNYRVVDWIGNLDVWPTKADGFQYNDQSYLDVIENHASAHSPDLINYQKILSDYQICQKRNSGLIDEVWIWGFPWLGLWEATMSGPGSIETNGPVVTNTSCNKALHIMGFNYERNVDQAMHSYGHRIEGIMNHLFGETPRNNPYPNATVWGNYSSWYASHPNSIYLGSIHNPANTDLAEYIYHSTRNVTSYVADIESYPNLTQQSRTISCTEWSCNHQGYLSWWLSHIPKVTMKTSGKWNNWWRYILDYSEAQDPITGDLDHNRHLDHLDFAHLINRLHLSLPRDYADLNQDTRVNIFDLNLALRSFGNIK